MKETRFIAQNKEKWQESETLLTEPVKDPEKLSNLFTQIVDDLSYSRTYYPNRSVRVYLNKIAREYFSIIYSHQKEKKNRIKLFWLDELPQIIIYSKKQLTISFLVFILSATIGIFSSINDPHFASSILGDEYISMTKENIAKGDPMAVYKKGHQVDMFLGITANNLMVAFRTYVFGIFMSIGTLAILLYNGIMVGCFQYFFVEQGLLGESALTIWLHGTLEISSIIIAGGAGITLGSGLIFPGTYSRLQAFQLSAIRSLKLMLGIAPIIILAGIIESFLTRYTDVPDVLRFFLILLSAAFIVGYFIIYPWHKSKKGFATLLAEDRLPPTINEAVNLESVKSNAELVKESFLFYLRNTKKLIGYIAGISVAVAACNFILTDHASVIRVDNSNWFLYLLSELFFAVKTPTAEFIVINALGSALILFLTFYLIDREVKKIKIKNLNIASVLKISLITGTIYSLLFLLNGVGNLIIIFTFILFVVMAYTQHSNNLNFFQGFAYGWRLFTSSFGQVMGLQLILLLMAFSFLLILSAPLLYMHTTIVSWNFAKSDVWAQRLVQFIEIFFKVFAFNLFLPILASCAAYLYYTLEEIMSANHLKRSISFIGSKHSKLKR